MLWVLARKLRKQRQCPNIRSVRDLCTSIVVVVEVAEQALGFWRGVRLVERTTIAFTYRIAEVSLVTWGAGCKDLSRVMEEGSRVMEEGAGR
jgi:hypothetical protein